MALKLIPLTMTPASSLKLPTSLLDRPEAAPLPLITVIVPVRNEAAGLGSLLPELMSQSYDPRRFEVIVADGRSTDDTRAIVSCFQAEHPQVRLVDNPQEWSSAGRNAAIRAARGDLIVLVDGHCELHNSHYLAELASVFQESGADCVGRPQPQEIALATPLQQAIAAARASWLGHNPASYIYSTVDRFVPPASVAVAYRRQVFETVGLFDESFDACEDVEFNHRVEKAGFRCFFTPRVAVHYHPRTTLTGLSRQLSRYGRGRVRLLRKFPATFTFACFLPALLMLAMVLAPVLIWMVPWLGILYGVGGLAYFMALGLTSLVLAVRQRRFRLLGWLPLVFLAIHAGAGMGILQESLCAMGRRQPSQEPILLPQEVRC
jgi:succinoglycan biosynthesis protein ExoA